MYVFISRNHLEMPHEIWSILSGSTEWLRMTRAGEGDALAANGRLGGDAEVAEDAGVCLKYCPGAPLTSSAISDSVPFFGILIGP